MRKTLLAAGMAASLLGFSACWDQEGAGPKLDAAMRSLAKDAEDALLEISRELDDAVESGREVARGVGDQAADAADDAVDAADEAFEAAEDAISDG